MSKMFVHYSGTIEAFKAFLQQGTNAQDYANKIVFIKGGENGDGAAVYTHGEYYGNVKDALAALQNKVDGMHYFSKISDGTNTATVTTADGTITFSAEDSSEVSVNVDTKGVVIGLSEEFKTAVNETLPDAINAVDTKLGAKGDAAASGADASAFGRIKNLETIVAGLTGEEGDEVESIDAKITKAINELDVNVTTGDYVKTIKQVDGKIVATTGTFDFDVAGAAATAKSEVIGASGDAANADTIFGAKKHADEAAAAAQSAAIGAAAGDATEKANAAEAAAKAHADNAILALDADVIGESTDKRVKVQVTEVDGKITAVTVNTNDIASAATLAAVKSDVDYFLGSALNKDNAEAVKDTLKEIQDYIDSDVQGAAGMTASIAEAKAAADAAQAAADKAQGEVDDLEAVVANVSSVANAAATKVEFNEEKQRVAAKEQVVDAAIKAISDDYLKASDKQALEGAINSKVAQTVYDLDKAALEKADSDNLQAAKEYADGLVEALDVTDAAVAGEYVSAVSETNGVISVSRTKLPTYTLASGSQNGTVALNGVDAAVTGLGSAAFTESSAYATAAQGAKADAAAPQATTYTKTEVDSMWAWEEL